jgi:hypothetical protein
MQDYVSMVLLWFMTEQQQQGTSLYELESLQNQIETLNNTLDKAILGS